MASNGYNYAAIIGNLGRDPEGRPVGEDFVCNFTVATNESWKDKRTGELKQRTEWHRVVVWGPRARACFKHLRKGRQVSVIGKTRNRSYMGTVGEAPNIISVKKYVSELVANDVIFLGGSRDEHDDVPAPTERDAGETQLDMPAVSLPDL
jgi:single-strand DNA-binding protein